MEELVEVLQEISDGIKQLNVGMDNLHLSLEEIKGDGLYDSITDIYDKLEDIKGSGLYDSVSDLNEKLDSISLSLSTIEINTM